MQFELLAAPIIFSYRFIYISHEHKVLLKRVTYWHITCQRG